MNKRYFQSIPELNQYVGKQLFQQLTNYPRALHFLPTGNTFIQPYQVLIEQLQSSHHDFRDLIIVNVDEYLESGRPLPASDSRSFAHYMEPVIQALAAHGFQRQNHIFPYFPYPHSYQFEAYERLEKFDHWLSQGQCASAFLGLGPKSSPHIAFASPGYTEFFSADWRDIGAFIAPIDTATRKANAQDKGMSNRSVPEWACTISPGTLLQSQPLTVYLVAYGTEKDVSEVDRASDVSQHPAAVLSYLEARGTKVEVITFHN